MNNQNKSRFFAKLNRGAWARSILLALLAFGLLAMPLLGGEAQAAGESNALTFKSVRFEFDDHDNAANLRPTSQVLYIDYYNGTSSGALGGYWMYASSNWRLAVSASNLQRYSFRFNYTTSNNWQYYTLADHRVDEDGVLVLTFKIIDAVDDLKITLNWSDNSNASNQRPTIENFVPTLYINSNASRANNGTWKKYESDSLTFEITDNHDDTWTLLFKGMGLQPTKNQDHYGWLTWKDSAAQTQQYYNQAIRSDNMGYMRFDLTEQPYAVTTYAYTDKTLTATLTWDDMSNKLGKRPTISEFKPTLRLSRSSNYATSDYAYDVTIGENGYSIIDNGDDTWTINFTDVNAKEVYSQHTGCPYLWLTWEGSDAYKNDTLNYYYFGYTYANINNTSSIKWMAHSKAVPIKLTWADNKNEYGKRPSVEEFKASVKLLLSTSTATAEGAEDVTGTDFDVTDNGDNTWSLLFKDSTLRDKQNSSSNGGRYLWLTWKSGGAYANELVTYSQEGVSYRNVVNNTGLSDFPSSTELLYTAIPNYLTVTLQWEDNKNELKTRPDANNFQPKLILSTSTSSLTNENSKDVTGSDYTVTDNGNDTWTIVFHDTTARAEKTGNMRYLWLTWDGDGKYLNEDGKYFSLNSTPYLNLGNYSSPNLSYVAKPRYVIANLTWYDNGDAAGLRPLSENFQPTLFYSNNTTAVDEANQLPAGNYDIIDNGNGSWTIVFWDSNIRYQLSSSRSFYIWLNWKDTARETQFYANSAQKSNELGATYSYLYFSYGAENRLNFKAVPKVFQFRLNWNDDNGNFANSRPDKEHFIPHLWGTKSSSTAAEGTELTGTNWTIEDKGNYWVVTLLDADALATRGNYSYLWLTWEDSSLVASGDSAEAIKAKQYYFNQSKSTSDIGYTYQNASNDTYTFNTTSKLFNIRVYWEDDSNSAGLRPETKDFVPHIWYNSSRAEGGTVDYCGTDWRVVDNGDNSWTITFLNSELMRTIYNSSYYVWMTWDGSDCYINNVKTRNYGTGTVWRYKGDTYTYNSIYRGDGYRWNGWNIVVKPKFIKATLEWHDNEDAFNNRPKTTDFIPHLWMTTSTTDATTATDVTGDYEIIDNNDNTWTLIFKNSPARETMGTNGRYMWLTWDGSAQYYNTALKNSEYGYTYAYLDYKTTNPKFVARQKAFQILLKWEDGDNYLGYRPSTDSFVPHVLQGSSSGSVSAKSEITGTNWTVKDNGDQTWLLSFPQPENIDARASYAYYWLIWDGSDNYYNKVTNNNFGYMRANRTDDDPYYVMTTRAKHRELPLILNWDDYGNASGTRPDPTQFTPHLWYSNSQSGVLGEFTDLVRDVDYQIITDQDHENKWMIRYLSIPFQYINASNQLTNISYYWLTWDGSEEYYNQVLNGSFGSMYVDASSYNPRVTTRLKDRSLTLKLTWDDFSNEGGYRPTPSQFTPQLHFGSDLRANVPIDMSSVSYTITDNGDNTWTINFQNVPYATATNSGSNNTYGYYWLTWTGSEEYWNQQKAYYPSGNNYGAMYFSRTVEQPAVTTRLKTRSRLIRLYWRDNENAGGFRPTPEQLLANMHLWYGNSTATEEIDLSAVNVIFEDTTSSPNYWDIRLEHLPYYYEYNYSTAERYYDNNNTYYYLRNVGTYWLTWDGDHYINQVKNTTKPGAMYFSSTTSSRTDVECYPDENASTTLYVYWFDNHNSAKFRPDPENFDFQISYGTDSSVMGTISKDDYEWEIVNTTGISGEADYWQISIKNLPRSIKKENGQETPFSYYWLTFTDPSGKYTSQVKTYDYNGQWTNRSSNNGSSLSMSNYLNHRGNAIITLTWDDNSNADGLRPKPEDFKPHLGYSNYGNSSKQLGVIDDLEYDIKDNENNTWTITFKNIPLVYTTDKGDQRIIYRYWFTCDDVDGYTTLNDYNTTYYSISSTVTSNSRTNNYTLAATLKRETTKNIAVTLNWYDNTNDWGRRPTPNAFTPHLWAGDGNEVKREIPLTADQWEITDVTPTSWKLNLKNVEALPGGNYWLTWEGSDYYFNQITTNRSGRILWSYSSNTTSQTIYPKKVIVYLNWNDNSNTYGKRPDPNSWQPVLHYGTSNGVQGDIPLSASDWYISSSNGNPWTVEFYKLPDQYTNASGDQSNISYFWLTFDTEDDFYYSDKTTVGYGELKWPWNVNSNYSMNVYMKKRPITISLTWKDANQQVGERPEPTPESFGAHLWYGDSNEVFGEFEGLNYTVTDNGNNKWTIDYEAVPTRYKDQNGMEKQVLYYWLTFDGGKYFLNNITNTFKGTHGAMYSQYSSSVPFQMIAYCDYYRIGASVSWNKISNIANVSANEIDHSHTQYDLVDLETGKVLDTWEPTSPNNSSYSHAFYLPRYNENGELVDHHRYTVVQRGTPGIFDVDYISSDYTSGEPGHQVKINNEAQEVYYRFNFTFVDDNNALKLRPSTLEYMAKEIDGNTYTYRGKINSISSTQDQYSTSMITLLGRDLMTNDPLEYEVDLTNLGKYYDVTYTRRVDDDGVINLDYTLTLKKQVVTLQIAWDDESNKENWRPSGVTEYLLANGVNIMSDNMLTFTAEDAVEGNPNLWQKQMVLPTVDADGNPITWSMKQAPSNALRYYHAEQESTQEPDFGGQTVTLTNIKQDAWNYAIDLYWVSYGKGSLPDKDYIDVRNRYDIYETVEPNNDDVRKYKYEMNISVNSAHYAEGDLEVRLPYYMKAVGANGQTRWVAPQTPTNDISVPQAPAYNPRYSYNYYIDTHGTDDKSDDEIVFVNWEELSASSNTKIQVIYTLYPHEHLDTHIYELQAHGTGYATLNYDDETHSGEREDVAEEQLSNEITFGMDTGVDITAFSKRANEPKLLYYYNTSYIDSAQLSRAAFDTENFDYVAYYVNFEVHANQYSTFSVSDLPGQNGEIVSVKYSSGSSYNLTVNGPTFSADKRVWTFTVDPYGSRSDKYMYRGYWVVVAYPKSEGNIILEDGRIFTRYTNEADIEATALHKQNPDDFSSPPADHNDHDAMNDATLIEWGDYRWKPSGKIFYYDKDLRTNFNSNGPSKAPGGQTVLEYGEDISASFRMVFYVNGDELALDGVHEYYRFNITDNELWLHGTVNGGKTEYVKLEPGDYEITSINVDITARRTDHTTGEPLSNPPLGQFVLQAQTNETGKPGGEWRNIKSYSWPTGSTNQNGSFSATGLDGNGYTGYRVLTPRVNEYVRIDTYFTVKLKAESEKVKALLANGEQLTEIEMLNIAAFPMETEEPDGSWKLYTDIYRDYSGMVKPGVPSHTDNEAVRVGLYGNDPDRLTYGQDVELIYDHAMAQAGPITSGVGSSKNTDQVVANSETEIVRADFTLNAYQNISNTNGIPLWLQHKIVINEGFYYDLLPEGWSFDPERSVIVRRSSGGAASMVGDPVIINDYKGTNRQMIIFHVKTEGDQINYYSGTSGFSLTFGAAISYEDNALYPRGYNIAVFQGVEYDENGNPMYDESGNYVPQVWELMHTNTTSYYDDGSFGNSVYQVIRDDGEYVFHDVNGDGITQQNDVLFMSSFVNPNFAKSVQTGVDKLIMGKSGVWQLHDVTDLDTDYYYYISYKTTGQGTSRGVVIYDVLENAANTAGHTGEHFWKGTFVDVDVSYARSMGIDAKVYYSTNTNLDENNNFFTKDSNGNPLPDSQIQMDIDKRKDLWLPYTSTTPKEKVTAIAVDLRMKNDGSEMVFDGYDNSETYFTVTMHSPKELPDDPEAILAYNRPCYQTIMNSGGDDTPFFNINDRVTIELHDLKTVRLRKITRSDPLTGENGEPIMDENGKFTFEEMPLGSVYFHLYKLTCQNESHKTLAQHAEPPYSYSLNGTDYNNCWTRIAVVQTQNDGVVEFKNLEGGTYALREYSQYYYSSDTSSYAYVIPSQYRLRYMWWSFDVDVRSKNEPVLVYQLRNGNAQNYNSDTYKDFYFGTKDSQISDPEGKENTRTVWNVRPRQSLTIRKQWWPENSEKGKDPEGKDAITSIKVNILRNGEIYMRDVELTAAEKWIKKIDDLPVTSAYGTRYNYTVEETEETREKLKELGFAVVVDNNAYTGLGGSATNGYTQERRLHNAKTDHLVLSKFVTEGGDRVKQYLFSLRLTDQEGYVLSGRYDYTRYKLDEETQQWKEVGLEAFKLDANGTWSQLQLAHDERIVIHDLPIGTSYVLKELGADGYVQTTNPANKLSGKIQASQENEDLVTNKATITNGIEVTNTYQSEGRTQVTGSKTINGRLPVYFTDRTFYYYLKEVAWKQYNAEEGAPDVIKTFRLNGSSKVTINFNDNNGKGYRVQNQDSGAITFPTLIWQTGVSGYKGYRVYTVREEVDTERPGFDLDRSVYVVWVELEDNEVGELKNTIKYYKLPEGVTEVKVEEKDTWEELKNLSDLKFDNKYTAEGDLKLRLKKTINGIIPEEGPFVHQRFKYTLSVNENEKFGEVLGVLENDGKGYAEFFVRKFGINDVGSNQFFRYFLQEDALDEEGITIDSVLYSITLQITDKGKGNLGAKVDIVSVKDNKRTTIPTLNIDLPHEDAENYETLMEKMLTALSQKLTFDNKYEADGKWQPGIKKLVNGQLIDTSYFENNSFTFTLSSVNESGKEIQVDQVKNGTDGTARFNEVSYTSKDIGKTYTYVIHETGASGHGITVNDTPFTITLRVDDLGKGKLNAKLLSIKKGDQEVWNEESGEPAPAMYEFDNSYEATGELTIEGTKELKGRVLRDKEFEFAIMDADGNVVSKGTSDENGKITFETIKYTQKEKLKHYEYKVYEVKNGLAGITYDDLEWKLSVTVKDNGTGKLDVTYKLSKPEP